MRRLGGVLLAVAGASCALPAAADPGEPVGMGEYGVERTEHDVAVAVGSKAFAWLTGSAADDELLPLGKSAQFFGFEGLRASSQRAAQRGTLGRAVFALATDAQRDRLARAVVDAAAPLAEWWQLRGEVVAHLRERRFLDEVPPDRAGNLGERWGHANGAVAWVEAAAFAEVERTLTADQWSALRALRADPGRAAVHDAARVTSPRLTAAQAKELEDLCAKAFAWWTGGPDDLRVVPVGQPGQFFGFEALRLASGHGVVRADVAARFWDLLTAAQAAPLRALVAAETPQAQAYLAERAALADRLTLLRTAPRRFDGPAFVDAAAALGAADVRIADAEAVVFRDLEASLTSDQRATLAAWRGAWVRAPGEGGPVSDEARLAAVWAICAGCHEGPHAPGPSLVGVVGRAIGGAPGFDASPALRARSGEVWTPALLDVWLRDPRAFAPGTRMGFAGLADPDDRRVVVAALGGS